MEKIKETILKYMPEIEKIFGNNLVSVIIFGSAVRGDFVKGKSDINILIVRNKRHSNEILKLHKIYKKLRRKINLAVPLLLTVNEIRRSTDVFPMEYRDIKDFHLVIKGKDIFKNLKIEDRFLRLELESQIKGKLILLRESFIQSLNNKKVLRNILLNSIPAITVILRNVFILNRKSVPQEIESLITSIEKLTKIKFNAFRKIIELKKDINRRVDIVQIYSNYITEIEKLSDYIDKFKIRKKR